MAFLNFDYSMKISYSRPVDRCYFTIKSFPADDFRQRSISYEIGMLPNTRYSQNKDSFGNTQIIGCVNEVHPEFVYTIKGLVETYSVRFSAGVFENTLGMYKYPHGKCIPGDYIKGFAEALSCQVNSLKHTEDKIELVMDELFKSMSYESGSTGMETGAEEAFLAGKGVCQDYAHIMISLLRLFNIPARYVCGLIVGEGKSHAWVEAACGDSFIAFDPTHNQIITDEYIKLGVGRDALDCAINRGIMWGGGSQLQDVTVKVDKYD